MVNKEGILFTSIIALFAVLYVAQLAVLTYVILSRKIDLKKIEN